MGGEKKMDRSHNFCDFFRSYYFSLFRVFFFFFNIFERITDIFGLVDENVEHIGGEHGAWRVMYINWELILKTERFVFIYEINSLFSVLESRYVENLFIVIVV